MAKQTKTENPQEAQTDAFGENQVTQNPYTKSEPVTTEKAVETNVQAAPEVQETKQEISSANEESKYGEISADVQTQNIIQPTLQEAPVKPTLTDQEVYEDFSADSTVKVKNANGVTVKLSGTAAQILKGLDATTKIV